MADEADGIPGAILARSHGGSRGPTLALSGVKKSTFLFLIPTPEGNLCLLKRLGEKTLNQNRPE